MGFLKKIFRKKERGKRKEEIVKSSSKGFEGDVLNLGWYYSENKKE